MAAAFTPPNKFMAPHTIQRHCDAARSSVCRLANALVGNDDHAAALEVTLTGPSIKFLADTGGEVYRHCTATVLNALKLYWHWAAVVVEVLVLLLLLLLLLCPVGHAGCSLDIAT